jgi:type IV fimbrial biogenesis protein FimT
MLTRKTSGFTLIELMVTLTLLGILLALAIPAFGTWIANSRVRTAAEIVQNALRLAQTEAVRANRQAVFGLSNTSPDASNFATIVAVDNGAYWFVQTLPLMTGDAAQFVQAGTFAKQSGVTITGPGLICFNSTGRQVTNSALSATCTAPADATHPTTINISKSGSDRALRIQVALGGQIRMCDPLKSISNQPDGC